MCLTLDPLNFDKPVDSKRIRYKIAIRSVNEDEDEDDARYYGFFRNFIYTRHWKCAHMGEKLLNTKIVQKWREALKAEYAAGDTPSATTKESELTIYGFHVFTSLREAKRAQWSCRDVIILCVEVQDFIARGKFGNYSCETWAKMRVLREVK